MTLEEKAGLFFQNMITIGPNGELAEGDSEFGLPSTDKYINKRKMNHFNILTAADTAEGMARWHNAIQKMAEETRLGIPITISTDPRHSYSNNPLAGMLAGSFSVWPEPIGFGAIADPALTETFGDIARQEYTAVGIRLALHPEVDLAILRVDAPYEEWPTIFENFFHSGSLDFPEEKIEHFKSVNLPR